MTSDARTHRKAQNQSDIQTKAPAASATPSPQAWTVGKMFSISTRQPMRQALLRETDYINGLFTAQRYIEAIEASVIGRLKNDNIQLSPHWSTPHLLDDDDNHTSKLIRQMDPCNLHHGREKFRGAVKIHMEIRRLPPADLSCLSEYIGPLTSMTSKELFDGIQTRSEPIRRNRVRIANMTVGNWSNDIQPALQFEYETETTVCRLNIASGFRVARKWYLLSTLTKIMNEENVAYLKRQTIAEYHHVLPNHSLDNALQMTLNIRPRDGDDSPHKQEGNATTILLTGSGVRQPSHFAPMLMSDIPAVKDAMDIIAISIQQANDALTPSSIAILILPLILNLFPSILFMHLSGSRSTLIYVMLTDVMTVIPLAIKGIELIVIGQSTAYSASGRISSPVNGTFGISAGAEIWGARCRPLDDFILIGSIFVSASILSLIVGIGLEVVCQNCMARRKEREEFRIGWENQQHEAVLDSSHGLLCLAADDGDYISADNRWRVTDRKRRGVLGKRRRRQQQLSG